MPHRKIDIASVAGPVIALAGILGGLLLERGRIADLAQWTALLIVFGGTFGAVAASTPPANLRSAARRCRCLLFGTARDSPATIASPMHFAFLARRGGVASMEAQAERMEDPVLRKALLLAVDGVDASEIRGQLEARRPVPGRARRRRRTRLRERRRIRAHRGNHRRGSGADPGDEATGRHRTGGPRRRGSVRGDDLWRGSRQPAPAACRRPHPDAGPPR